MPLSSTASRSCTTRRPRPWGSSAQRRRAESSFQIWPSIPRHANAGLLSTLMAQICPELRSLARKTCAKAPTPMTGSCASSSKSFCHCRGRAGGLCKGGGSELGGGACLGRGCLRIFISGGTGGAICGGGEGGLCCPVAPAGAVIDARTMFFGTNTCPGGAEMEFAWTKWTCCGGGECAARAGLGGDRRWAGAGCIGS